MKKIIIFAILVKVVLFCVALLSEKLITCKDESTQVYLSGYAQEEENVTLPKTDQIIRWALSPFLKWDSHYFVSVAERGYTHEKIYAFYPLYPLLMRYVAKCFPFLLKRTAILLSGFLISNVSNILAIHFLYKLTLYIFSNETFASLTCLFYSITPASVFTLALYTEPVFAFFTFHGMYLCFARGWHFLATPLFILSAGVRSNGILNAWFIFYFVMSKASLPILIVGAIECISISLPTLMHEESAFNQFCLPYLSSSSSSSASPFFPLTYPQRLLRRFLLFLKVYPPLLKFARPLHSLLFSGFDDVQYAKEHGLFNTTANTFANSTLASPSSPSGPRSWCLLTPAGEPGGSIYGHVQLHYWNVGFLRYFTLKQLPNHFLCWPILSLACGAIYFYFKHTWKRDAKKEAKEKKDGKKMPGKAGSVYPEGKDLFPFVAHLAVMVCMYVVIHAQVMTRFMNNSPVLFWFFASILYNNLLTPSHPTLSQRAKVFALVFYCIGYALVGTVLFSTFNPWT